MRVFTFVLALGFVGTSAMLFQRDLDHQTVSVETQLAGDAAFRDGLYLGRMAHSAKSAMHPPVGRWSTDKDRASFVEGYRRGFTQQN